ncbi:MAG: hypothetical protein GW802_36815, partial [Armatimonadetes bacterium]|nr:hypothetical protein [Armatimonadota bacterium]
MAKYAAWMGQAKVAADTDAHKANVRLFEKGVWEYMVAGRKQFVERQEAPIPSVTAPRVPKAGGDLSTVDWAKAAD